MKIICERNILIHQAPKWKITEDLLTPATLGAVPSERELKKGRKHLITGTKPGDVTPIQDCPDWCGENGSFKRLVEKGVIQVVKFVSTPVSVPSAGTGEEEDSDSGKSNGKGKGK